MKRMDALRPLALLISDLRRGGGIRECLQSGVGGGHM